ncbi:MAG: bis(5'-nucleosyl)-tetraphosphatase (symmetrical) YqeK [Elusimicrobia bacterium]|jgi:predicted HD superfamily hydrolase involved in NAD metabolism|nr:bis(5'-nucleosyl)-tetraphosphatase (symmetrical) YqeK [Elusimicrobiota bacterium]
MTPHYSNVVSRLLSTSRAHHSREVARWSVTLACLHGADPDQAERAGFFHDVAKEWSPKRLLAYVRRHRMRVPGLKEILTHQRLGLLHGPVSAHWAAREGYVRDAVTCRAMARHTLGHGRMGLLDKILYVADFSSKDRRYVAAGRVRRLAYRDLEAALRLAVAFKLQFLLQRGGFVHPLTVSMWNGLLKGTL